MGLQTANDPATWAIMQNTWDHHFETLSKNAYVKVKPWHSFVTKKEEIHYLAEHAEFERAKQIIKQNL